MIFLDDYSIECLSLVPSDFLGIHRNSFYFFGSQIYSWREYSSGQRSESSYGRTPDYSNLGLFRLRKTSNRMGDPQTAEFQQVLHSGQEGAKRERQSSIVGYIWCLERVHQDKEMKEEHISIPELCFLGESSIFFPFCFREPLGVCRRAFNEFWSHIWSTWWHWIRSKRFLIRESLWK